MGEGFGRTYHAWWALSLLWHRCGTDALKSEGPSRDRPGRQVRNAIPNNTFRKYAGLVGIIAFRFDSCWRYQKSLILARYVAVTSSS
jgi:hypothetical protein